MENTEPNKNSEEFSNKKILTFLVSFSLLGILVLSSVSAFAVSSKYWEEKSLELYPGQSEIVQIFLQNMAGDKDITVKASMLQPAGIAEFSGDTDTYSVPLGQKVQINISFTAPENAVVGTTKSVILSFKIADTSQDKNLGIGSSIEKIIPVVIVPKPVEEKETPAWIYLIVILLLLIIIFILWKVFSKNSKKK